MLILPLLLACSGKSDDSATPDPTDDTSDTDTEDTDTDTCDDPTGTWWFDDDGDGYGDPSRPTADCVQPKGTADNPNDCNDAEPLAWTGNAEVCGDDVDNDCDGTGDLVFTYYADTDGDLFGDPKSPVEDCSAPKGHVEDATDCDDGDPEIHPGATERCNGLDDDCLDGPGTTEVDVDLDTWFACQDCNDDNAAINPGMAEVPADTIDNDCDGGTLRWSGELTPDDAFARFDGSGGEELGTVVLAYMDAPGDVDLYVTGPAYDVGTTADAGRIHWLPTSGVAPGDHVMENESYAAPGETPGGRRGQSMVQGPMIDGGGRGLGITDAGYVDLLGSSGGGSLVMPEPLSALALGDLGGPTPTLVVGIAALDSVWLVTDHDFAGGTSFIISVGDELPSHDAGFGAAVAIVDDCDGAGTNCLLAGAPEETLIVNDEGRVALYIGLPGETTYPDVLMEGSRRDGRAGSALASVGDVNGDGYTDWAVGAPGDGGKVVGRTSVFFGPADTGTPILYIDAADLVIDASDVGDGFGAALSGPHDFNQDGVSDLLVSAAFEGRTHIWYGPLDAGTTTPKTAHATIQLDENDKPGGTWSQTDITDDTAPDLVLGAPTEGGSGAVFVFAGAPL